MDENFLKYYNSELQYLRELSGEFANAYPKVAGRLGLDSFNCADPYVERLLEGFAFLTGRIQYKIDRAYPDLAESVLSIVYPQFLVPTPAMMIASFTPNVSEGSLAEGYTIPRNTVMHSRLGPDDETPCKFTTTSDVALWPIEIADVEYLGRSLGEFELPRHNAQFKSALRLQLKCSGKQNFSEMPIDHLRLYLRGPENIPMALYETLMSDCCGVWGRPVGGSEWGSMGKNPLTPAGFSTNEALFPEGKYSMQGYRLLREYFAFYQRFMFIDVNNLASVLSECDSKEIELIILLRKNNPNLEQSIDKNNVALFCSPAINLFEHRCEMITLDDYSEEYHVVPSRTRQFDYEVFDILSLRGHDPSMTHPVDFKSFYHSNINQDSNPAQAYYILHRSNRMYTDIEQNHGTTTSYMGSDVHISLVDNHRRKSSTNIKYLSVRALCTNRDLTIQMARGLSSGDLVTEEGLPIKLIKCLEGPTLPLPSFSKGLVSDKLLSHLSLNYFSLDDSGDGRGTETLREILGLYCRNSSPGIQKHIDGILSVCSEPVLRRIPGYHYGGMARGLQVTVTFNETEYEGSGCYLLGIVLAEFFCQYVSVNSFVETVIKTAQRGELARWKARPGKRSIF